jgi:hypothetical protein
VNTIYLREENHFYENQRDIYMSFKKFSSAQDAPSKDKPDDKSKDAPAVDQPAAQPDKTPAEAAPAPKP